MNVQEMLTEERHQFIRGQLWPARAACWPASSPPRFGVSEDTVRRDLRELAKAGDCRRVYGGAVAPAPYAGSFGQRSDQRPRQRRRLAAAAVKLLAPRQTLFIDASTTNIAIARAIPAEIELTVATNAIGVAAALSGHELVELIVLGGVFDREKGACLGGDTLHAIAKLSADLFFLGACGVDACAASPPSIRRKPRSSGRWRQTAPALRLPRPPTSSRPPRRSGWRRPRRSAT